MRNPDALWEALVELCETNDEFAKDLEIRLGGIVSESIRAQIINTECLKSATTFIDYIPHNEVYKEYAKASDLLLILNNTNNSKWILPSKLYEYIYSGQPILMLGEIKSDAAEIVASFEHNCVVDFNEKEGLKAGILAFYQQYKNNQTIRSVNNVSKYSRKNLTVELAEIMNDIIKIIE